MRHCAITVALCGCTSVFGLDRPQHEMQTKDGAVDTVTDSTVTDIGIDALACPSTYTLKVNGSSSLYRIVATTGSVGPRSNDCNDDLAGATHLVVFETVGELAEVASNISAASNRLWVGAAQPPDQTDADKGWFTVLGAALATNLWDTGEPDDSDGAETNDENFAFFEPNTGKLKDKDPSNPYGAICECDGQAVDSQVNALFPP